jgi:3-dehydrosphinganine reductase
MFKIIAAGILALPCVVVIICVVPIVAILSIPALLLLIFRPATSSNSSSSSSNVHPDQVIIVGGSSGIGLGIAKECVRRKVPKITLLARDRAKLEQAQTDLQELARTTTTTTSTTSSQIHIVSVSVTDYPALEQAAANLQIPTTDHVVMWNCAGFAYPGEFLQVPIEKIFQQVETNQLGTLYLIRAFLPWLNQGCIVLTSSAAGQIGVYGLSTYAPTKYAIRGFAETLHAELIRSHPRLSIQMAFPVDTDTPGYQEELKTTPELTRLVVQAASEVATADQYVMVCDLFRLA